MRTKAILPDGLTKTGRKTKLTPELQDKIIKRLGTGFYIKQVCLSVGIGETTFYEWLKKGKEGIEPYREFRESTRQAEAKEIPEFEKTKFRFFRSTRQF